jgi:hypothetical protein
VTVLAPCANSGESNRDEAAKAVAESRSWRRLVTIFFSPRVQAHVLTGFCDTAVSAGGHYPGIGQSG